MSPDYPNKGLYSHFTRYESSIIYYKSLFPLCNSKKLHLNWASLKKWNAPQSHRRFLSNRIRITSPEERLKLRNEYVRTHIIMLRKLAKSCAQSLRKKFCYHPIEDLESDAMEGILKAIEHQFAAKRRLPIPYLRVYGYHACMHGALRMSGIKRRKKDCLNNEQSEKNFKGIYPYAPEEIGSLLDRSASENSCWQQVESEVIQSIDTTMICDSLKKDSLKKIYSLMMQGFSAKDIIAQLSISERRYYYLKKSLIQLLSNMDYFRPKAT